MGVDQNVVVGDCLEVLKQYPDDYFDAAITDPPYGLSVEPDPIEVMWAWLQEGDFETDARGFLGAEWDGFVPGPRHFRGIYRVMKPGAHLLCFGGSRTYDWMALSIRLAGFEKRDSISLDGYVEDTTLRWYHGQGFPKGGDVGKRVAKLRWRLHGASDLKSSNHGGCKEAPTEWDGWSSTLKPSWEPILVFRKPFKGSLTKHVLAHGTGALNIDVCRIGSSPDGRWPANLVLQHHPECIRVEDKRVAGVEDGSDRSDAGLAADWRCHPDCRVLTLEEQSGERTSGYMVARQQRKASKGLGGYGNRFPDEASSGGTYGDTGTAARFFYTPKAHNSERYGYCRTCHIVFPRKERKQHPRRGGKHDVIWHPTQKPLELMRWLVRLVTPPGGVLLDPYLGTGTTLVAAREGEIPAVGIDQNEEYAMIAMARLEETLCGRW